MKFGVVVFPGSNCDHDAFYAIANILKKPVEFIWHQSQDLAGCDAIILPGGFAHGDYLRTGAIARFSPVMKAVDRFARGGGLGVGGAVGGLVGALVGLGIPEYEAKRYEGRIKDGGVLLSVHCDTSDEIKRAKDLLKQTGAEDIASTGEKAASTHGVVSDKKPEPTLR